MALQHHPRPVFWPLVSNLVAQLLKRSYNIHSEDLPGSSGSAVLQVTSLLSVGASNSPLTWN